MNILDRIKGQLKKILPNKIIQKIRLGFSNIYYSKLMKKIEKSNKDNFVYVFGTAIHTNLGDHLITLSEIKFLKDSLNNIEIIEIPTEMYQVYKKRLVKAINKNNLIIINGGGWMGNLWTKEELLIQDMVYLFKNNRIIIFPQTIYYDYNIKPCEELINSGRKIFSSCKKLLLTVRDQQSYNFTQEHYPMVKSILVPDIALYYYDSLKRQRENKKENIIKYCLRKDRENNRNIEIESKLNMIMDKYNIKIEKTSTMTKKRIPEYKRSKVVMNRLDEFSKCKLIITDRLHGMIFAYLVGTPCIILDNKTRKVSGVYEKWLKNSNNIFPLYKYEDINKVEKFIDEKINNSSCDENIVDFSQLRKEIING